MATEFTGTNTDKIDKLVGAVVEIRTTLRIVAATVGVLIPVLISLVAFMLAPINNLSGDVRELKADVGGLKTDVGELRADVVGLKADVGEIKADVSGLNEIP